MNDDNINSVRELRESTGLNRKDFCALFQIPYRTVTEWELGNRHAPEYVLKLMKYFIQHEGLSADPMGKGPQDEETC